MSIVTLLPFIVLIGAMFLMTRSAKKKQRQAAQMRDEMQPGSGVRTIGGMYATVKEVHEETVLLEVGPGRARRSSPRTPIGAVLADDEYNRIVHGIEPDLKADGTVVPDDASSLTETDEPAADAARRSTTSSTSARRTRRRARRAADEAAEAKADRPPTSRPSEPKKTDGEPTRSSHDPGPRRDRPRAARPGTCGSARSLDTTSWPPARRPGAGRLDREKREGGSTEEGPQAPGRQGRPGRALALILIAMVALTGGMFLSGTRPPRVWASTSPAVRASRSRRRTSPASPTRSTRPT